MSAWVTRARPRVQRCPIVGPSILAGEQLNQPTLFTPSATHDYFFAPEPTRRGLDEVTSTVHTAVGTRRSTVQAQGTARAQHAVFQTKFNRNMRFTEISRVHSVRVQGHVRETCVHAQQSKCHAKYTALPCATYMHVTDSVL